MALQLVGITPKPSHRSYDHTHPYYEIIMNIEGEGMMSIGNENFRFFPGSIHIVPPKTSHTKKTDSFFRDIWFQTDSLSLLGHSIPPDHPRVIADDEEQTLYHLFRSLLLRYLKDGKNAPAVRMIYELILQMIDESLSSKEKNPLIEELKERLLLSFNDPECSVVNILCDMGYHPDYLRRIFVEETGLTPNQYLTSLRMKHARTLLKHRSQANLTVAEIGYLCGYYDPRYFSRVFKREVGKTPMEYTADS